MHISASLGEIDIEEIEKDTYPISELETQTSDIDFEYLDSDDTSACSIDIQEIENETKPIIIVLVEGFTDQRSLELWLGALYQDYKVIFILTSNREKLENHTRNKTIYESGDITTPGIMSGNSVDKDHIVGYLEEFVYTMLSKNHGL